MYVNLLGSEFELLIEVKGRELKRAWEDCLLHFIFFNNV